MKAEEPPKDRPFAPDDQALHPGWQLLEFLASIGADEFAIRFMHAGERGKSDGDRLMQKLAFASLGERTRECTVTYVGEVNPRPVAVWRFDVASRQVLREIMSDGILGYGAWKSAWPEDLCVYRRGELLFGSVTHERFAFLRLTDAERQLWETTRRA